MEKFCKLYESEKHGQILVMKDTTDTDQSCVFFIFKAPGVEHMKIGFNYDSEESRDRMFDGITKEKAVNGIAAIKSKYCME